MDKLVLAGQSFCPKCAGRANLDEITYTDGHLMYSYLCPFCESIHSKKLTVSIVNDPKVNDPKVNVQNPSASLPKVGNKCKDCKSLVVQGSLDPNGQVLFGGHLVSCEKGYFDFCVSPPLVAPCLKHKS